MPMLMLMLIKNPERCNQFIRLFYSVCIRTHLFNMNSQSTLRIQAILFSFLLIASSFSMTETEQSQESQTLIFNKMMSYIFAHEKEKLTSLLEKHPDIVKFSAVLPDPFQFFAKTSTILAYINTTRPDWISNAENWEMVKRLISAGAPLYEVIERGHSGIADHDLQLGDHLWMRFDKSVFRKLIYMENEKCTDMFTDPHPIFPEFDSTFLSSVDRLKDEHPEYYAFYMDFRKQLFETVLNIYTSNDSCQNRAAAILFKHTPSELTGSLLKTINSSDSIDLQKIFALLFGEGSPFLSQRMASLYSAGKASTDILSLRDKQGNNLFHYLAKSNNQPLWKQVNHQDLVSVLNTQNEKGQTPLHLALTNKNSSLAKQMIEAGATLDPDLRDAEGNTFLHYSIQGSSDMAITLMRSTFRIHILTRNKQQKTPFDLIAEVGDTRMTDFLANQYSHTLDREQFETSVISLGERLISHNRANVALELLQKHNLVCNYYLSEAPTLYLQAAMCQGSVLIEEIHAPASAMKDDPFGYSPLHMLAMLSEQPQIKTLLDEALRKGVPVFTLDRTNKTFIHYLVEKKQADLIFQALLETTNIGSLFNHLYELIETANKHSDTASATALQMFTLPTDLYDIHKCQQNPMNGCWKREDSPWSKQFTDELKDWQYPKNKKFVFSELTKMLKKGSNPNLGQSFSLREPDYGIDTLSLRVHSRSNQPSNIILMILFGSNLKDHIWGQPIYDYSFDSPENRYRNALREPEKLEFKENTKFFRKIARNILTKIEAQGRLSHIHPICTCLSLSPVEDSKHEFQPSCQLSLNKARNEWFKLRALDICESYGYTAFDEDSDDSAEIDLPLLLESSNERTISAPYH